MKRLIALLMTLALLLGTCAFAAEEEKAVAPTVKFNSSFYLGYLNQEVNITVSCTKKTASQYRKSIWSCAIIVARCSNGHFGAIRAPA